MAIDKGVDSKVLDEGLTQIADAIRKKRGTSEKMAFPEELAQAILATDPLEQVSVVPGNDEQILVPSEGFYGIGQVTVAPVTPIPAALTQVRQGGPTHVSVDAYFCAESVISDREFIQTHALYNDYRLPLIPEDPKQTYPKCFIVKEANVAVYYLYYVDCLWYKSGSTMYQSTTGSCVRYRLTETSEGWESLGTYSSSTILIGDNSLIWTNYDIPSGSASATSYYKRASEPGVTI